jgi:DNA-3-methyladenine glycosylase
VGQHLPPAFFARPAELVAPGLIGCRLVKRQEDGELLWGVIVETEAYSQEEPACHGHRRRSPSNETLFGEPGRFYVYVSYGIHHCVNVVTHRPDWASGVLLRALALPGEPEGIAAGPALLARRFGIDRAWDGTVATPQEGLWLAPRPPLLAAWLDAGASQPQAALRDTGSPSNIDASGAPALVQTSRMGISRGQELPWRWYLRTSRSVSRRARGDRQPAAAAAWRPDNLDWNSRGPWLGAGTTAP